MNGKQKETLKEFEAEEKRFDTHGIKAKRE